MARRRRGGPARRVGGFVSRHRIAVPVAAVLLAGLATFVIVWFEPHKLFIEQTVNEAAPRPRRPQGVGGADPAETMREATSSEEPAVLAEGEFRSLEHGTTGRALILELSDGRRFLRFEDLNTSNGPDLRVYLSEIPAGDDWHAYGERFIDLGPLKGNIGSQNYGLPDDLDLSRYRSAVVWCRRFTVGFGVAPLNGLS